MRKGIRETKQDRIFNGINMVFMILIFIIFAWPLWFVVVASFSDPNAVTSGQVWLWPVSFHTGGYVMTFENTEIWRGYLNSIFYTILGTAVNMVLTVITAYPLSRMDFMPRKFLTIAFVITMYFGGGMVPTFLQVRDLGLTNTIWAMIIQERFPSTMYCCSEASSCMGFLRAWKRRLCWMARIYCRCCSKSICPW